MTVAALVGTSVVDEISKREPDLISAGGSRTWSVCGRNFVVAITELEAGERFTEHDVLDEYVLLVQDEALVGVEHGDRAAVTVSEPALIVVPAGTSAMQAASSTTVARVFTARCAPQVRSAVNHGAGVDLRAAPLPDLITAGGDRIRVHRLRDIPQEQGRLGRIFQTTSLMVNGFPVHDGPRDTEQLSPHSHEDFEQMSVTLVGDYAHHLRVPWTPRMSEWRDDENVQVGSPSMTLIPPTVVHTTRAVGAGPHTLIDVFAPPREDFLAKGWVLNAAQGCPHVTAAPFPQLGAWVKLPAPESVELLAIAGFDFVVIDAEHGAIDIRTTSVMIGLARGCGVAPFVRVVGTAPRDVQVPLDAGAAGLFVPQVDDAGRARDAVRATRFPPLGRRGASTSGRAGRWGLEALGDYLRSGNDEVRLVVQAESVGAVAAITEIGEDTVDALAVVFIGPTDLAVSSQSREGDGELAELVADAERRCSDRGITLGTTASGNASDLLGRRGYDFLVLGADSRMLRHGASALVSDARTAASVADQ